MGLSDVCTVMNNDCPATTDLRASMNKQPEALLAWFPLFPCHPWLWFIPRTWGH